MEMALPASTSTSDELLRGIATNLHIGGGLLTVFGYFAARFSKARAAPKTG